MSASSAPPDLQDIDSLTQPIYLDSDWRFRSSAEALEVEAQRDARDAARIGRPAVEHAWVHEHRVARAPRQRLDTQLHAVDGRAARAQGRAALAAPLAAVAKSAAEKL